MIGIVVELVGFGLRFGSNVVTFARLAQAGGKAALAEMATATGNRTVV